MPPNVRDASELDVCGRLRASREHIGLTQDSLATQLRIPRATLAHYETGRARLPAWLGLRFCRQCIISERWLAMGTGEMRQYLDLVRSLENKGESEAVRRASFLEFFRDRLRQIAEDYLKVRPDVWYRMDLDDYAERPEFLKNLMGLTFDRLCLELPRMSWTKLHRAMTRAGFEFLDAVHRARSAALAEIGAAGMAGEILTQFAELGKNGLVIPTLPVLLKRLAAVTKSPGSKGRFAAEMGIPLSRLSKWANGRAKPSGDHTLELLRRVQEWEEKQNGPDGAATPPEPKARPSVRTHETNPKTSPPN